MKAIKSNTSLTNPVKWIFGSLISVTLYFQSNLVDPFNSPKFWILIIIGAWLTGHLWSGRQVIQNNTSIKTLFYLASIFILGALLSTFFSDFHLTAIFGEVMRKNGFLTYLAFAIILTVSAINIRFSNLKNLIQVTFFVLLVVVFYGTLQTTGNDFIQWNNPYNSVIATVGNPNFAAAIMAIMGVLIFSSIFMNDFGKNFRFASVVLSFLGLFVIYRSNARQGLLSYVIGVSFFLIVFLWSKSRKLGLIGLLVGSIFSFIGILGMLQMGPLEKYLYKGSVSVRGYYWRAGFEMLKEKPLFGIGMDSYGSYFKDVRDVGYPLTYGFEITSTNAHNTFIQFFATGGLILGSAYLLLNLFVLRRAYIALKIHTGTNRVAVSGVVSAWITFHAQSFVSIDNIGISIWGWVLAGAIVGTSTLTSEPPTPIVRPSNKLKTNNEIGRILISSSATLVTIVLIALLYRTEINTFKIMSSFDLQNPQVRQIYRDLNLQNFDAQLNNPTYRLTSAMNLVQAGFVDEGVDAAKQVLKEDVRNLDAMNSLAGIYEQTGKIPEAIDMRIRISEIDQWNAKNYLQMGKNYKFLGDEIRTKEMLTKILSFASNNPVGTQARTELVP
jgi:O-antigen ligase